MQLADRFAQALLVWFDQHGRHDLPWQHPRTPYRVWLAEIMLQQTQVATVIGYFLRFVDKFPTLSDLAAASLDDVLAVWSGLGYYNRARNAHRAAQICVAQHAGELPRDFNALLALPGIGRSTAGAILAQAFAEPFAILDGNVKRVLARFHGVDGPTGSSNTQNQLWQFAHVHTPRARVADYTQAIMDLGATVCTRSEPRCDNCPLTHACVARTADLTHVLPQRKLTRALPRRSTLMLLLRDARGRLLLQRRPPTGVWAQLWSFPEATDMDCAKQFVKQAHCRASDSICFQHLPSFVHTFTHFHLDVTPLALEVASRACIDDNPDQRWLLPAQACNLGLPAPVRKLIQKHAEEL